MVVGIKDIFKLLGIIIVSACAVFVCTLFMNYNADLQSIEEQIATEQARTFYDALVMTGTVVVSVSGGSLLITAVVMLAFYIKHYIDSHRKELGILKALGYSNLSIAAGFWVFGLSVFLGAGLGFCGAYCLMPEFYLVQNEDKLLPKFEAEFHTELLLFFVILPTVIFALLSVFYAYLKMKTPVLDLLRGKSGIKAKEVKLKEGLPFVKDMKNAVIRGRKSLVFFIGFAAFCYSAMVQMFFGMDTLGNEIISAMVLLIGLVLAFTVLFIAVTSVVKANGKNTAVMRAFGYSEKECRYAVLNGYRPAAFAGFSVGTIYQYALLKIMVTVVFADVDNVPEFNFDFAAFVITFISFTVIYELVMFFYGKKMGRLSLKEIMLDSE